MAGGGGERAPAAPRSVVGRALAVLGAFTDAAPELGLGDIAAATGLASATTHRIVAELVAWGALERAGRGRYRVGMRLWRVGSLAPVARDLRDAALPAMQDLAAVTGHVVHLVVIDGHRALFLERLPGAGRTASAPTARVRSRVGRRMPLHASGPGKVLLAHASPAFVAEVVAAGLPRLASGTITDPDRLAHALGDVRRTGYCLSRDEMTEGSSSVAAPILDPAGEIVASLAVVVPSATANLHALVPAVRVAAATSARALHPRPPAFLH